MAEPAAQAPRPGGVGGLRRFLLSGSGWPYLLVPFIAIAIALELTHDGESTWYEGVQLLAVYAVLGVVFFYA
jgi:Ca2+/H+ antiporter